MRKSKQNPNKEINRFLSGVMIVCSVGLGMKALPNFSTAEVEENWIAPQLIEEQKRQGEEARQERLKNEVFPELSNQAVIPIDPIGLDSVTAKNEEKNTKYEGECYQYIGTYAGKYGVSADLMYRIIKAESGGRANAKSKISTATGCSQFTSATWIDTQKHFGKGYQVTNPEHNVEAMAWWISEGHIEKWDASKSVWSK